MKWTAPVTKYLHGCRRHLTHKAIHSLLRLSARMGPERIMSLGRGFGRLAEWSLGRRLQKNMRLAGLSATSRQRHRYFDLLGRWAGLALLLYQKGITASGIARRIHLEDSVANLDRAMAQGRGAIIVSPHFFCYDIVAGGINLRHPLVVISRENKDPRHNRIKERWYQAIGTETVLRSRKSSYMADALELLRVLQEGKILAFTPDLPQKPDRGIGVKMFGREVFLPPGMVALAMIAKAPLVAAWGNWLDDPDDGIGSLHIGFDEAVYFPARGNKEAIIQGGIQQWSRRCEEFFHHHPELWMFWLDKSWTEVLRAPAA